MPKVILDRVEIERLWKFQQEHHACGMNPNFEIVQDRSSGIGVGTDVICRSCGKKQDITNFEHW